MAAIQKHRTSGSPTVIDLFAGAGEEDRITVEIMPL